MATRLIQSSMAGSRAFYPKPSTVKKRIRKPTHNFSSVKIRLGFSCSHSSSFNAAAENRESTDNGKRKLLASLQGVEDRGMFGVPSAKKTEIENLIQVMETRNPTREPTLCLEKLGGAWKLIYSTITVLGSKRTKLGLRDFIALGEVLQSIDVAEGKAVNVIKFSAKGLNLLSGQLTIEASFKISSKSRVDISYLKSVITPDQLMNVFRKNFDLLLGIFNPEGWLEITYLDDTLRIGRDDKGNTFVLERLTGLS